MATLVGHIIDSNDSVYEREGGAVGGYVGVFVCRCATYHLQLRTVEVGIDFCRKLLLNLYLEFKHRGS